MIIDDTVLLAFALTLFAGLSTGIGSALAFFTRRTNTRFLSVALGFSAGVMIYISFTELLAESRSILSAVYSEVTGQWMSVVAFFAGILLVMIIDSMIPAFENPHEVRRIEEMDDEQRSSCFGGLYRTGIFTAIAIAIHNFPEGFATFMAVLIDPGFGLVIAIAIAFHNIPEGIAVSVPIYYATGDRRKAFFYSFLSGLSEPLGALIGFLILAPFLDEVVIALLFALVAGIMVYISLDELLPAAREYGESHLSIYGLVAGMGVLAVSLILFDLS